MQKEELQARIDQAEHTPEGMRRIAEAYLRGDVLRDPIAAEGWLQKVIESEDSRESMIAMILLAKEILGKEHAVSEKDLADIQKEYAESDGKDKENYLYILRELELFYDSKQMK